MNVHPRLDYDVLSDLELAARVAERDERAVRLVTKRNNQTLFRAAWSILRNRDEAEDAVQAAWLRAFAAIRGFRGKASLSTWLTRIAINVALGRLRAIRRKQAHVEDASRPFIEEYRENLHNSALRTSPDECVAQAQLGRLLERAIARLPPLFRTVFVLREVEGLSVSQVAEVLEIPLATVRTRHLRARRNLQNELAPDVGEGLTRAIPFAGIGCEIMTGWVVSAWCRCVPAAVAGRVDTCARLRPLTGPDNPPTASAIPGGSAFHAR